MAEEEDDGYEFEFKALCIHETWTPNRKERMSLLVRLADGKELWIPYANIHEDSEVYAKGDSGKLVIKSWWAEKQGYE